jgi:hypothetical protein
LSYNFGAVSRAHIPHQFGVLTLGGYETIIFGIKTLLKLHLDWVEMQVNVKNVFNNVFQIVIFKKFRDANEPLASIVLPSCIMVFIFLFITTMGNMKKGSPLLNHFQTQSKVTP